jgi:anti-sigma factor RsiW
MAIDEIRCRSYEDDWSALLDGELPPERAAELSGHLTECARCRARVELLREVDALLTARGEPSIPEDLRARLQARIDSDPRGGALGPDRPAARWRWRELPAAVALAAAAAAVAYLMAPDEPVAPEQPIRTARAPSQAAPETAAPYLTRVPVEDVAVGLELEDVEELELEAPEDLDVIANLELLEAFLALDGGTG